MNTMRIQLTYTFCLFVAAQKLGTTSTDKAGPLMMDAVQKAGHLVMDTAKKVTTIAGKTLMAACQATGILGMTLPENRAYNPDEPFQSHHLSTECSLIGFLHP